MCFLFAVLFFFHMVSEPKAWSFHCWGKPFHRVESTLRSSKASGLRILQRQRRTQQIHSIVADLFPFLPDLHKSKDCYAIDGNGQSDSSWCRLVCWETSDDWGLSFRLLNGLLAENNSQCCCSCILRLPAHRRGDRNLLSASICKGNPPRYPFASSWTSPCRISWVLWVWFPRHEKGARIGGLV